VNQFLILTVALAWLAIVAGGWLGWQLLRQNGWLLLRLDEFEKRLDDLEFGGVEEPSGLAPGSTAPDFELPNLEGERKALAQYRGQPLLLIFFNPACGFCRELAPKLKEKVESRKSKAESAQEPGVRSQESGAGDGWERPLTLIVSTGDAEANRQFFREQKIGCPVLVQKQMEVATAYEANGTPSGYLINADGKIASELAVGTEGLFALGSGESNLEHQTSKIDQSLLASASTTFADTISIRRGFPSISNGCEPRGPKRSSA